MKYNSNAAVDVGLLTKPRKSPSPIFIVYFRSYNRVCVSIPNKKFSIDLSFPLSIFPSSKQAIIDFTFNLWKSMKLF